VVVLVGGCSNPPPIPGALRASPSDRMLYQPQPAPHEGGTVTIGDWESPTNFAPLFNAEQPAAQVDALLFSGLVRETADLQWLPDLAQRVPTLDNGDVRWNRPGGTMDVTYHLRPGAEWSDGTPITAEDVAFTWRTIVDPRVQGVLSTDGYAAISRIEVRNALTIVLHLDRIYPQYLQLFPAVLPQHRLADIVPDRLAQDGFWSRPDVVSGPYKISELVPDEHITLVRRRPHVDRIVYKIYPELGQLLDAANAGQVDLALEIPEGALVTLPTSGKLAVQSRSSLAYEQVTFNQLDPNPLTGLPPVWKNDATLLAALRIAIDRAGMVRVLLGGRAAVADSPIPSALSRYRGTAVAWRYDLAQANRLLDQDGWVRGADGVRVRDGRRLTFSLTTALGDSLRLAVQDQLIASWQKLGVDVTTRDGHPSDLFGGYAQGGWLERGAFEAGLWTWSIGPDPDGVYPIEHSSQIPSESNQGQGANFGRFQSRAIDESLVLGRTSLRESDRVRAYAAFERAYARLGAELPLYQRMLTAIVSPRLHNLALNPAPDTTLWNSADWWVD
jgi:peptide/nickel transport system substrate-binding protein